LLLDANDNLKISDFGMATVFRFQGRERHLDKRCGTLPYIAPEVLCRKYAAEPADIWSCGVVLVAMLAGELPWDVPSNDCPLYTSWKECQITRLPWTKIDTLALSLLRKVLMPLPGKRYTIQQITNHQWFQKKFKVSSMDYCLMFNALFEMIYSICFKLRYISTNRGEYSSLQTCML
jgi:serine/threonine-protein kinase Chk1